MKRRSFLTSLLAIPLAPVVAKTLAKPEGVLINDNHVDYFYRYPDSYPHFTNDILYRFHSEMERDIYEALRLNDWTMFTREGRKKVANIISPVINRHMHEWRENAFIYRQWSRGQEMWTKAEFSIKELKEAQVPDCGHAMSLLIAERVWRDAIPELQTIESLHLQQGVAKLVTNAYVSDYLDRRVVGFDIVTLQVEDLKGMEERLKGYYA